MDWKKITKNTLGTGAAGLGLAQVMAGLDWISIAGIVFACVANLIGLLQKPPQKDPNKWPLPPLKS